MATTWVNGAELCAKAKAQAIACFVFRSVGPGKTFATDEEWLRHTSFAVRKDGLLCNRRHCRTNQPVR